MKLSIVIPTHNESARIQGTLRELTGYLNKQSFKWEILVEDDGKDDTVEKARKFKGVRATHYPKRLGKGGAIIKGFQKARGEIVLLYDADAATPAKEITKLLAVLKDNEVAIGCRYCKGSQVDIKGFRLLTGKSFNLLARLLFSLPFGDTQCGFKAARREAIQSFLGKFKEKHLVWDVEFLFLCKRAGLRVAQVPIEWRGVEGGPLESGGAFSVVKAAFNMLKALLRLRFAYPGNASRRCGPRKS
jgi:glycosyltransferase involved in cell wall biosynthesis